VEDADPEAKNPEVFDLESVVLSVLSVLSVLVREG